MHIESLTLTNFRCFGAAPTKVALNAELTTIVGPNGAGKTALLQALMRLFGVTRAQTSRRIATCGLCTERPRTGGKVAACLHARDTTAALRPA